MEQRDIEIFLAVAEELHFGRAAERLRVSTARVSQTIKKVERLIGTPLFERTTRRVRLTAVGEQLHAGLRPAYDLTRQVIAEAVAAGRDTESVLRVGMLPSNSYDLRPYWEAFRSRHPRWRLQIRHNPFIDAFAALRGGEIDALVAWLPVEEPDLTVGPVLFAEPRVILASPDHQLARRGGPVSMEVLGDFPVLDGRLDGHRNIPAYWEDSLTPFYTPKGRTVERSVSPVATLEDIFTLVGTGQAVQPLTAHAARFHARPDIAYLPVSDPSLVRWGLVWRSAAESAAVRALARVVRDLGPLS
ncbi:LysR family transcriptional regulator [Nonomuraea sp. NPDC050663]|uniref:LysR family transcriptional regulator n=1 Tax=Nonomuraea sp. NPDC050663 TaxID=3364370 RepID=UPI003788B3B2